MCDLSYEETSTLWKRKKVKARVARNCLCCGVVIAPGEQYERTASLCDHSWTTEWSCDLCSAAIEAFGKAHHFFPLASTFPEYLGECIRDDDTATWVAVLGELNERRAKAKP